MGSGRIVQVIGAVIDVEFPREDVPNVYDALVVAEGDLTLEVQQQWVMGSLERLRWVVLKV